MTGLTTLACIFGANALNKRQQASLISAYALLDNSYKEFKAKTEELYGEDAIKQVRNEIAKDKYDDIDIVVEDDRQLFYDDFSGRYFESTMADVVHAEYMLNRDLAIGTYVCLNEFYDRLGIPPVDGGDELGWNGCELSDMQWYSWIEFHHEKVIMDDGLECCIIEMRSDPTADYLNY